MCGQSLVHWGAFPHCNSDTGKTLGRPGNQAGSVNISLLSFLSLSLPHAQVFCERTILQNNNRTFRTKYQLPTTVVASGHVTFTVSRCTVCTQSFTVFSSVTSLMCEISQSCFSVNLSIRMSLHSILYMTYADFSTLVLGPLICC